MKIHLPDKGLTLNFPDGMTEDQMRDAINRNFYPEKLPAQPPAPAAPQPARAMPELSPQPATPEDYYPPEFAACDGIKVVDGVRMGQQDRAAFCLAYRTIKGNDTARNAHGSIIHILYGLVAQPSEKEHETVNDSPTAASLSWDCKSTPVPAKDSKPTSVIELDSDLVKKKAFDAVTKALWGSTEADSKLLLPDDIFALLKANQA